MKKHENVGDTGPKHWIVKATEDRPHMAFWYIFLVSLVVGTLLFLGVLQTTPEWAPGWWKSIRLDSSGAGGFLQGAWGTAGSLAASFVAIVIAKQALALTIKQNEIQSEQEEKNEQLIQAQHKLLIDQKNTEDQTNKREQALFEFNLRKNLTEEFGPLKQSNLLMGVALNTVIFASARLNNAVSREVERVIFRERTGLVRLIDADACHAIARHVNVGAFKAEFERVKDAMRQMYDALTIANRDDVARLAVKKQLEINSQSDVGRALLDIYAKELPPQTLDALTPVDHGSFAELLRAQDFSGIATLRLVECWYQAALYGVLKHESWLKFTPAGDIQCRLDSAGEKDGLMVYSAVVKKLLTRSESFGEGLFFFGSLIALDTQRIARPENLLNGPDHETWRVNSGVLALMDFYNAIPSTDAMILAIEENQGNSSHMVAATTHPETFYVDVLSRLLYLHDSPSMRVGKKPDDIRSILTKSYSRLMVGLDQEMRSSDREFFNLCIGPQCFTPAQNQYAKVLSVANFRTIDIALEIQTQVDVHYKDFASYLAQELYGNAQQSLSLLLAEMVALLAFYDPDLHQRQITALYEMHMRGAAYLEAAATNGDVEFGDLKNCIDLLQDSIKSVQRNEHMSPDSRSTYSEFLQQAIHRITVAAGAVQS